MQTLDQLFLSQLKDIYYAERQILKALPKMAKAANSRALADAFTQHRVQTQGQVERLQEVFEILGKRAQGVTCEAINGIIEECEELLDEDKDASPVRDAGLAACGQAVEHYEMARYGTLVAWSKKMGATRISELLQQTLDEEKKTDQDLTSLSDQILSENKKAA
ncbi:YciE/YciF ferroxidase family protein [Plastoroseomonas arctica]|uniref:Ferritin-like domain-containing protein n=1 Tax=Plastoroseomonas arctica TaxID=1509237 RepID=A0AAF1KL87_9PROT|nr:ferritin-like domain-containing protein [Plastoroseomonas arctica]MBR0657585.1 ferritin-like domain-containing protein [Plastoroseomonas arctica]